MAEFGSISEGTMLNEDLIPCFVDTLRDLDTAGEYSTLCVEADSLEDYDSELADDILGELCDALNCFAPDYGYFGSNPGDGADYGFWLGDINDVFDGLKVSDLSEVPGDYSGEVLHVNDHGNMSLYACDNGELTEVWAVV